MPVMFLCNPPPQKTLVENLAQNNKMQLLDYFVKLCLDNERENNDGIRGK